MQLIEIIQLTLLIFIVLSATVFLISYLGYRRNSFTSKLSDLNNKTDDKKNEQEKIQDVNGDQNKIIPQKNADKKTARFKVFTPSPDDNPINKKKYLEQSKLQKT